ncbi:MAG: ESX secretion-associated protein EspG [Actinophytocola sp.]|uniref:ESX secretion-associated protein EspG n=1 Tax=Actinophytocola sp. TaxID=1872138 RepID=UPI003D6AE597
MTAFLSPLTLDFLWESLGAGEPPYPIEVSSHGTTEDERNALRQQVYGELRERDLLDGRVEDWLSVLSRAERSIDAVFEQAPDPTVCALAVAAGSRGVLATQTAEGLWLRQIDAQSLVSAVVDLLPAADRGTEPSITVAAGDLPHGRSQADRQVLASFARQRNHRAGQLAVNARTPAGRSRSPVLSWFDTDSGRYLTYARQGRDGHEWITIAPADARTLRHRLTELLTSVTGDRP